MNKEKKTKQCPICGCTEHRLVGCATHWRNHVKNDEGKCELRKKWEHYKWKLNNTQLQELQIAYIEYY